MNLFFPLDAGDRIETPTAMMHVVVASVFSIVTIPVAMVALWRALARDPRWSGCDRLTLAALVVLVAADVVTVVLTTSSVRGVPQKVTMAVFVAWIEVLALRGRAVAGASPTTQAAPGRARSGRAR